MRFNEIGQAGTLADGDGETDLRLATDGEHGVGVEAAPGHVHSPMVARHTSQEMLDLRRKTGPLGIEGTPWDVAWAALFLASDEARWVSGATLPVDAGLLAATPLAMYPLLQEEG